MNTKNISIEVLKRFMTDGELTTLMEKYVANKKALRKAWQPSQADIDMFNRTPKPTLEEWMAYWGLKSNNGVVNKLRRLALNLK